MTGDTDHDLIIRMAANVDYIVERLDKMNGKIAANHKAVNSLQKWRWLITGGVIVLGALYGIKIAPF